MDRVAAGQLADSPVRELRLEQLRRAAPIASEQDVPLVFREGALQEVRWMADGRMACQAVHCRTGLRVRVGFVLRGPADSLPPSDRTRHQPPPDSASRRIRAPGSTGISIPRTVPKVGAMSSGPASRSNRPALIPAPASTTGTARS